MWRMLLESSVSVGVSVALQGMWNVASSFRMDRCKES